ncbi:hypothetical protein EB796_001695 [Bugula neritina]|uniref:Uncharacterized protein n=1 Tax=Bugula neritina TaxID=10212 RepID=A0A7J7KPD3_BUGNE|nr:hypothetical protein EB796_001695 [Bugula neritina]
MLFYVYLEFCRYTNCKEDVIIYSKQLKQHYIIIIFHIIFINIHSLTQSGTKKNKKLQDLRYRKKYNHAQIIPPRLHCIMCKAIAFTAQVKKAAVQQQFLPVWG